MNLGERAWAYFCNITFRVCHVWNFPKVLSQQYQCWYFPWRQSEQPESASLQIPMWLGSGILFEVGTGCLGYSKEHHCLDKATKHETWKCLLFPLPSKPAPFCSYSANFSQDFQASLLSYWNSSGAMVGICSCHYLPRLPSVWWDHHCITWLLLFMALEDLK